MEQLTINVAEETNESKENSLPLFEKIQILIDKFSDLKEKHSQLTDEKNKLEMDYLELDDLYKTLKSADEELIAKLATANEELDALRKENSDLKSNNDNLENITKVAASKIDVVLSQLLDV